MRIAVVYDCLFPLSTGGGERMYRAFAEHFSARGHQVSYLTRRQWAGEPPIIPGVTIETIAAKADLYDDRGARRAAPAVGFAIALTRHMLTHRAAYDAVLVSALPVLNVLAVRVALLGTRTAICADFLEVWRPDQWKEYSGPLVGRIATVLQWIAVRASPMASCHAAMTAARLKDLGLRSEPIVSPGLIDDGMVGIPQLNPTQPSTVVFAGRLIPDKRVETIPAAIAWARRVIPDLRATIFGDGEQYSIIIREIERLGLGDRIDMPGFAHADVLRAGMRSAACLVNPSRREGYGLVVVEANSVGTPAVVVHALDNSAVELVDEGVNGFIAASTAPHHLGASIVMAIHQGRRLRETTFAWFSKAVLTRTVSAAAEQLLVRLVSATRDQTR